MRSADIEAQRDWLYGNLPPVIGHRGAAMHAPENTLASIRKAHELGAEWVEIDVKLSRDGILFLMHDDDLDRTTNGKGPAGALTLAEIQALDTGSWHAPGFAGEAVPTLEEVLEELIERQMHVNIEIKPNPGEGRATTAAVVDLLRQMWPAERAFPLLSSFDILALEAAAELSTDMPRGLLIDGDPEQMDWRAALARLGCASLHVNEAHAAGALLQALKDMGVPLLCYTVNEGRRGRALIEAGAVSVFSDAPERILAALGIVGQPQ